MALAVRPMRAEDVPTVAALTVQLGYDVTTAEVAERFELVVGDQQAVAFVAEESSLIVGWIHALDRVLFQERRVLEIGGLVVDDERRGEGIGGQLVDAISEWARRQGHTTLYVRSNVVRDGAHDFYPALGFVHQKTSHTYVRELE
ncbi:MAG: GNAT family N-acetyltransferase [Acidimicrobiia bacterium]|nr:GNAT family N-acetyltransferase [Acidimicrobiia bacterium]